MNAIQPGPGEPASRTYIDAATRRSRTEYVCTACGRKKTVATHLFRNRKTTTCVSCGTAARNQAGARWGGKRRDPLGRIWGAMLRRCDQAGSRPRNACYVGISVCPEWRDLNVFIAWAKANGWRHGLSLERVKNSRGYEPGNCTWIKPSHQARNKSTCTVTPEIARAVQAAVASGERRYHVAKRFAAATGIALNTVQKVAYGQTWVG